MASLTRPSVASYSVAQHYDAETHDHEDHTFCGVMFDVQCKDVLPLECVLVESLWVRGRLGPLTVWTTEGTFRGRHEHLFPADTCPAPKAAIRRASEARRTRRSVSG